MNQKPLSFKSNKLVIQKKLEIDNKAKKLNIQINKNNSSLV